MGNNKYFKDMGFKVTSIYGWRVLDQGKEFHPGVDLVVAQNGPIYAFTDGDVLWAGDGVPGSGYGGYGTVVAVKDKNNCVHVYGHLSKVTVAKGAKVKRGQQVGNQGNTGRSFGQHLHYEIRKQVAYVQDREKRCYVPDDYLIKFYGGAVVPTVTKPAAKPVVKATPAAKPAVAAKPAAKTTAQVYTVKSGDVASKIAATFKTNLANLSKLNPGVKDWNKISVGQKIRIK